MSYSLTWLRGSTIDNFQGAAVSAGALQAHGSLEAAANALLEALARSVAEVIGSHLWLGGWTVLYI